MLNINLWDNTFVHLKNDEGDFSMVHGKTQNSLKYEYRKTNYDGISIFTDNFLNPMYIKSVQSRTKIGWIIERREINQTPFVLVDNYIKDLDILMTNDADLLNKYPDKCRFVPFGGSWIKEDNYKIFEKPKSISMIYSNKIGRLPGYDIRHRAAPLLKETVDLYGTGANRFIKTKEEGLIDYRYSIVIENVKVQNYFTEKILDCFCVGTIPIYWGCPNIGDFFDTNGIITFNTIDELKKIVDTIEDNNITLESITNNLNKSKLYDVTENWIYENILKGLA